MKYYKIIHNEKLIQEFIDKVLPDLQNNERFYCSLFARKKYCQELIKSNDKTQLKRFLATKENLIDKLYQLEIELGRWKLKDISAPQESLVVYIHPNPRCMKKATQMMGKKCWDLNYNNNFNLVAESMSCVQKSKSQSHFVIFDIDTKENIDFKVLEQILPYDTYKIIETRGGYHLLVYPKQVQARVNEGGCYIAPVHFPRDWFVKIREVLPVEKSGDLMSPIPGTIQGGFIPKLKLTI